MYYSYRDDIVSWRNQILHAKIQGDEAFILSDVFFELQGSFWGKQAIVDFPQLRFAINSKAPLLDNYFTGLSVELYSIRLINLLREFGVSFESFPVTMIDRKTKQELPVEYHAFHLLDFISGLEMVDIKGENAPCYRGIKMFRIKEAESIVLICEDLKKALEKTKISGCRIIPAKNQGLGTLAYLRKKAGLV